MEHSLKWNPNHTQFFITILVVAGGFIAYHFISKSRKLKNKFIKRFGKEKTAIYWVLFERFLGVFFYGLVPLNTISLVFKDDIENYGIAFDNLVLSGYWILGLSIPLVTMNFFNCKKEDNLAMYPQIRVKEWNTNLLLVSAFSWVAYLLAYEFLFRGYFLFVSVKYLGVWPAIALNIAIYALVHVPKGIKEAVGALPLGIVLGIITIKTGNIWVAFVVHIVLALTNEWFSLRAHPEMKYVK